MTIRRWLGGAFAMCLLAGSASAVPRKDGATTSYFGNQHVRGSKTTYVDKGRVSRTSLRLVRMKDGKEVGHRHVDELAGGSYMSEWTTKTGKRIRYSSDRAAGTWKKITYDRGSNLGRVTTDADKPGDPQRYELDPMGSVSEGIAVLAHLAATTNRAIVTSPYGVDLHIQPGESPSTILRRLDGLPKR